MTRSEDCVSNDVQFFRRIIVIRTSPVSKPSLGDMENVSSIRETVRNLEYGDPLYEPGLDPSLPPNCWKGVRVGDVGCITPKGAFDFLFNVCAEYQQFNPSKLPHDFMTIDIRDAEISETTYFSPDTHLFNDTITQTKEPFVLRFLTISNESNHQL